MWITGRSSRLEQVKTENLRTIRVLAKSLAESMSGPPNVTAEVNKRLLGAIVAFSQVLQHSQLRNGEHRMNVGECSAQIYVGVPHID